MRSVIKGLALTVLLCALDSMNSTACAETDREAKLRASVDAYSKQEYAKSKLLLDELVKASPNDPVVHYLLANNLLATQKMDLAQKEYEQCLILKPTPHLAELCQKAIAQLKNYSPVQNAAGASAARSGSPAGQSAQPPMLSGPFAIDEQKLADQQSELIDRFNKEQIESVRFHKRIADIQINKIKDDANYEIAMLKSGRSEQAMAKMIREEADKKIKRIMDALERDNQTLAQNADRGRQGVQTMASSLRDTIMNDKGEVRMMPAGTNLYTRNYVSFGDGPEPEPPAVVPLRAEYSRAKVRPVAQTQP